MNRFTTDPVKILLTKTITMYETCINSGMKFEETQSEYDIIKEILDIIEFNNSKKTKLRVIKNE